MTFRPTQNMFNAASVIFTLVCLLTTASFAVSAQADTTTSHAIAMHGDAKYGKDFVHFDYVNPDAPKGGIMNLSGAETFDNFNGFITKGVSASGLGLLYQSLMEKSQDEAFSQYGALAETITTPEDRSWVIFKIREDAIWHDGKPVTADDVVWTFNTLIEKGAPFFRAYYAHVETVEAIDDKTVKFSFT